ncbi:hypothetical protein IT402_00485 [Candidatus Nomurabacteria bacterium]|nr:hypothetical protein [Candidatus Nomurabacteria bacterium]
MNTKTIIVIIVILVLGFFLWKGSMKKDAVMETPAQELDRTTQSDSTSSIEEDLNYINVDTNTDADLMEVDGEIKSL